MSNPAAALEVAPPGWEDTVLKMKSQPGIDNPWALAWWMADQGAQPKEADADPVAAWAKFKAHPDFQGYNEKHIKPVAPVEAVAASTAGQLQRPQKPLEAKRGPLQFKIQFQESAIEEPNSSTREVSVVIIKEGLGNKIDRHFYSAELLNRTVELFEGVKAYADHPSKSEETDRPERSVRDIVGYYHSPRIIMVEGKAAIAATLKINDGACYDWAWNLVREAAAFAKRYADKELIGISINAYGSSHQVETADGVINLVDDFAEVGSADIVTQAGAGGGFRLREAIRKALALNIREGASQGGTVKELLQKHGDGLKALRDKVKTTPEHEAAYGPALEELMGHNAEMGKAYEALIAAKPEEPKKDEPTEPANQPVATPAAAQAATQKADDQADAAWGKVEAEYKAGKLTDGEKKIYEMAVAAKAEIAIKENAKMVSAAIKESGIPEAYAGDLSTLCAGKPEADVKKIVETRKALVAPILANKAIGAGAGTVEAPKKDGLSAKLAECGVKLHEGN